MSSASTRTPESRVAEGRQDADLRAGPRRSRRQQRAPEAAFLLDRSRARPCARRTPSSSPSARRRGAATATPISPMSTRPRATSPPALDGFTVVVTKSTVPVGTGDEVERIIRETRPDADFAVVSNPEFLREGAAIDDFKRPDRIVIGVDDDRAPRGDAAKSIGRSTSTSAPLLFTSRRTSELTKYAANAFLATKITFINEIADLCEKVGANVQDVARGIGLDNRIGSKFLHAGPGYGGSCFPKDTLALIKTGAGSMARRCASSRRWSAVNDQRKRAMARKVIAACGGSVRGKTHRAARPHLQAEHRRHARCARRSRSSRRCRTAGAQSTPIDPEGMDQARPLMPDDLTFFDDPYACADGADALVIVTEWDEFRALDLDRVKTLLTAPGHGRSAQYLRPGRNGEEGVSVFRRRQGVGATRRDALASARLRPRRRGGAAAGRRARDGADSGPSFRPSPPPRSRARSPADRCVIWIGRCAGDSSSSVSGALPPRERRMAARARRVPAPAPTASDRPRPHNPARCASRPASRNASAPPLRGVAACRKAAAPSAPPRHPPARSRKDWSGPR